MSNISELIDNKINESINNFDNTYECPDNSFRELLSMGELVDRLSIVNFKLFTLKNEVMDKNKNDSFKAWASVEDVKLVMERARLKKCIDEKLLSMIKIFNLGDTSAGFNPEVKKYGD